MWLCFSFFFGCFFLFVVVFFFLSLSFSFQWLCFCFCCCDCAFVVVICLSGPPQISDLHDMLSVDTMLAETVFAFCILLLHGIVYQLQIKCYYSRFTSPYSHKGNTWFTLVRECILLGLFKFGEALSLTHLHMLLLKPKITVPIIKEEKKKRDLLPITFRYTVLKHSLPKRWQPTTCILSLTQTSLKFFLCCPSAL